MADHKTPDFQSPRRAGGDRFRPDTGTPRSGNPKRGKYPADGPGPDLGAPANTKRGSLGKARGDSMTPARPSNQQVPRIPPRKPTRGNTTTNPVR